MLASLVYLQQGNVKKSKKLMKIVNTDEENFHIFRTTWEISIIFSGKMCLILKVTKMQDFTLFLGNAILEKPQEGKIEPSVFLGLRTSLAWCFCIDGCF